MARTYTDTVQWRNRANSTETWSGWFTETTNGVSPYTFASALPTNKEYEVQIVRQRPGSLTKTSNGADETQSSYYLVVGTVSLVSGAAMSFPGTYSVPDLGSTVTVTRSTSNPSLVVTFGGANWNYVALSYNDGQDKYHAAFNSSQDTSVTFGGNTYTELSSAISKTGVKSVAVGLAASQRFTLYVKYQGSSSGSILVKGI